MVTALASYRRSPQPKFRTNSDKRFGDAFRVVTTDLDRDERSTRACAASVATFGGDEVRPGDDTVAPKSRRSRPVTGRSDAEFRFQDIVHGLRVGLAAGRLHHLADEPAGELRLGFGLGHLVRIGRDDVVDHLLDRAEIGYLLHAARID